MLEPVVVSVHVSKSGFLERVWELTAEVDMKGDVVELEDEDDIDVLEVVEVVVAAAGDG